MKCEEIQQLRDAYLDSELDAKTTLEIQQHVATCGECARLFETEAKLEARLMAGLREGQRTTALWEQVERRVVAAAESDARPRPSALAPRPLGRLSTINSQLSALLWPHPKAWAGLAAVWLVILAVNFATRDPLPVREARKEAPVSRNLLLALKEQEQLLAELTGTPPPQPAEKPKPFIPQPRSQRREDCLSA